MRLFSIVVAAAGLSVLAVVSDPVRAQQPPQKAIGKLLVEGVPDAPAATLERIEPYQNARSATLLDFEASGKGVLLSTRFGDVPQVHQVAGAGLYRQQLTFYPEPIHRAVTDPRRGNSGFYFTMDTSGSEAYQHYWFDRARGQRQLLSDGRSRNEGLIVSHAGGQIAFASTRRNGTDFDIYTLSGDDPAAAKLVASVQGLWNATSWSSDDRQLLLHNYVSVNESYLYVLDLTTGERRELNPAPGKPIAYASPVFAASRRGQARGIYYASDEDREFLGLTYLDLKSGRKTLLRPDLQWDVTAIAVSEGGDWLAYTTNAGGTEQLYLASTVASPTPAHAAQVKVPVGVIHGLGFDRSGKRLGFSMSTPDSPGDVYVADVSTRNVQRWTYSEVGGLPRSRFVIPDLIQYPTFDQRQIPAWIYRPAKPSRAKLPVVVLIHGGPESQSMASWNAQVQYWVNELGVAVVAPNVRGSSGYGKSYLRLDNGKQREDSVADIGALLDWIATQKDLDAGRVAVYGGSYGGYMVLASLARYGERLRCGVDMVGISNFVTFLERTESYRRDLRRKEYGDERDPAMRAYLESIAPTTNAAKIKAPLLVAQGKNDPRVPAFEAEQIVATARKNGNPVWYILASDEGHGFQKKANRDYFWSAVSLFFEKHLLP